MSGSSSFDAVAASRGAERAAPRARGRGPLLAVLLACAAPVIASYAAYYWVRPEGRRNFGTLIERQPPLPELATHSLAGAPGRLGELRGQWLLVSVAGGACAARCRTHLYLQRQLRESLGREKDRLDWVWLIDDDAAVPEALQPALAPATVRRVAPDDLAGWLAPDAGRVLADHLYLVDPMGRWMMRFPAGLDAAAALRAREDLQRLLQASASWDRAGRQP